MSRGGAWLALVALCLACAGGPAPRDHFYRLEIAAGTPLPAPVFPGTLEVERLRADALTGGIRIVQRAPGGGSELLPYAYHQWVDSPTLLVQTRLCEYLRAAQAAPLVVTPELRTPRDFALLGRIARLEIVTGDGAPRALVELELAVTRERDRAVVLQRGYREERAAAGASVAEATDAAGAALSAIFERFLADAGAASLSR